MIIRRVTYNEDYRFVGLFDPHKDYPFVPLPSRAVVDVKAEPLARSVRKFSQQSFQQLGGLVTLRRRYERQVKLTSGADGVFA